MFITESTEQIKYIILRAVKEHGLFKLFQSNFTQEKFESYFNNKNGGFEFDEIITCVWQLLCSVDALLKELVVLKLFETLEGLKCGGDDKNNFDNFIALNGAVDSEFNDYFKPVYVDTWQEATGKITILLVISVLDEYEKYYKRNYKRFKFNYLNEKSLAIMKKHMLSNLKKTNQ